MNILNIKCKILINCEINASEDSQKIRQALTNIFPSLEFKLENYTIYANTNNLQCLEKIYENIQNKQLKKPFNKQFRKNIRDDSFWFYLNKQAAFANVIVLCERDDESALGPIKISIKSQQVDRVADWLLGND